MRRYQRRYIAQQFSQEAQVQNLGPKNKNTNQQLAGICGSVKSDGHWYDFQDWINPMNNIEHAQKYFRLIKIIIRRQLLDDEKCNTRECRKENLLKKLSTPNFAEDTAEDLQFEAACPKSCFRFYICLSSCSCFVCIYINE